MMSKILQIIFKTSIIFSVLISLSSAELINPKINIDPVEVIKIQLEGLQKNDLEYKDSGIELFARSFSHIMKENC